MRRRGFTLVELLVVIGIIAILIAILLPALAKARRQAMLTKFMSNEHQIMIGVLMYANQNNGTLPFGTVFNGGGQWFYWDLIGKKPNPSQSDPPSLNAIPFFPASTPGYAGNNGPWICPFAQAEIVPLDFNVGNNVTYQTSGYEPAFCFSWNGNSYPNGVWACGGSANFPNGTPAHALRITQMLPTKIYLGDGTIATYNGNFYFSDNWDFESVATQKAQATWANTPFPFNIAFFPANLNPDKGKRMHAGYGNFAFVDGHVERFTLEQYDPSWRSRGAGPSPTFLQMIQYP